MEKEEELKESERGAASSTGETSELEANIEKLIINEQSHSSVLGYTDESCISESPDSRNISSVGKKMEQVSKGAVTRSNMMNTSEQFCMKPIPGKPERFTLAESQKIANALVM